MVALKGKKYFPLNVAPLFGSDTREYYKMFPGCALFDQGLRVLSLLKKDTQTSDVLQQSIRNIYALQLQAWIK